MKLGSLLEMLLGLHVDDEFIMNCNHECCYGEKQNIDMTISSNENSDQGFKVLIKFDNGKIVEVIRK